MRLPLSERAPLFPCRDGGIDATIDHDKAHMESGRPVDVYSTDEPQAAFHARIAFCMDIHNEVGACRVCVGGSGVCVCVCVRFGASAPAARLSV
jgi:hypothetical protein